MAKRSASSTATRTKLSEQGLNWSEDLKKNGLPFNKVVTYYANKLGQDPTNPGPETYRAVIEGAGRSNPTVTSVANTMVGIKNGLNLAAKPLAVMHSGTVLLTTTGAELRDEMCCTRLTNRRRTLQEKRSASPAQRRKMPRMPWIPAWGWEAACGSHKPRSRHGGPRFSSENDYAFQRPDYALLPEG